MMFVLLLFTPEKGTNLVTAGSDYTMITWDNMYNPTKHHFDSPVSCAFYSPNGSIIACPLYQPPVLLLPNGTLITISNLPASDKKTVYHACWSIKGDYLYLASSKGQVHIVKDACCISTVTTCSSTLKSIQISGDGDFLLLNCADRILRLLKITTNNDGQLDLSTLVKYMDSVERVQWVSCAFSASGDYVIGAAGRKNDHHIYIWDQHMGNLLKVLEGPMESILDLAWHPCRPLIVSVGEFSGIYIWTVTISENWSAFAPDFREIEENVEYQEKEDEFDNIPVRLFLEHKERERAEEQATFIDINN